MVQRLVEGGLPDTERLRSDGDASGLERPPRHRKALVDSPDHVPSADRHVVEDEVHAPQPADAERIGPRLAADAFAIERQQERRDAAAARSGLVAAKTITMTRARRWRPTPSGPTGASPFRQRTP